MVASLLYKTKVSSEDCISNAWNEADMSKWYNFILGCAYIYIYIYTYNAEQKYKTTLKNEEKIYCFPFLNYEN